MANDVIEVIQEYIKLPLDADGVSIKPGDELVCISDNYHFKCGTIVFNGDIWWVYSVDSIVLAPCKCRHVQPKTVESLLDEMLEEARCRFNEDGSCEMGVTYGRMAEYAERIRKAEKHD